MKVICYSSEIFPARFHRNNVNTKKEMLDCTFSIKAVKIKSKMIEKIILIDDNDEFDESSSHLGNVTFHEMN
jgi:hypothetical protein